MRTLVRTVIAASMRMAREVVFARLLGSLPNQEGFTAGALGWRSLERIPLQTASFENSLFHLHLWLVYPAQMPALGCHHTCAKPGRFRGDREPRSVGLQDVEMNMERCASIVEQFYRWNRFEGWVRRLQRRRSIFMWTIVNCQQVSISNSHRNRRETKSQPTWLYDALRCPFRMHVSGRLIRRRIYHATDDV
ncbi:hypothetical protein IW262DRAFT_1335924 [Armillaria fumosa]|nr:hypothetical protein IW262DRAFT_1335924 [Armillaria fumosa]